jgi:DNA modification methylase
MPQATLLHGDCREELKKLADSSVDSVCTDPPYALVSIVKRFGSENAAPAKGDVYARASAGFMGKQWDTGEVAFDPEFWHDVLRVLKPGGHVLAFGGTRTYHRLVCAIEDAGFEVRDQLAWVFGSGFPKSHDVSKGVDKAAGISGSYGDFKSDRHATPRHYADGMARPWHVDPEAVDKNGRAYLPATPAARQWQGWGTALKPAHEPIVLARKPLIGTIAANVLAHGTGGLNIGGCRVHAADVAAARTRHGGGVVGAGTSYELPDSRGEIPAGRWPANLIHDGSDEVLRCFPETTSGGGNKANRQPLGRASQVMATKDTGEVWEGDSGSAARFFYCAKSSRADRNAGLGDDKSTHPTVKPTSLMRYLCRLITPPGGVVLDPFMGSGSTGRGAILEGFSFIGIEREAEYIDIARRRISEAQESVQEQQGLFAHVA